MGTAGVGFALIITFLTYWLYGVGFEVLNNGVTPGKKTMRLRVVHDDGTPIRLPASLVRNFLLTVDFLPMAYAAGIISLLVTKPFKRIGDLAAGTMVVYNAAPKIDGSNSALPVKRAPVKLMLDEQTTLVDYLERAPLLNEARANELALILTEVMHTNADRARQEIEQVAAGFKGASQDAASGAKQ